MNNSNENKLLEVYPGVFNLSDFTLSDGELSLLSKGLGFVDTPPPPDLGEIMEDINKFHLSIKRHLAFTSFDLTRNFTQPQYHTPPTNLPFKHQKFKNPSKWNPPGPHALEHVALLNERDIIESSHTLPPNRRSNLSKTEFIAKRTLSNNRNIIIKKADKGSAVVIQNRSDYIAEGLKQLNDRNFYKLIDEDLTPIHQQLIKSEVSQMFKSGEIDLNTSNYLIVEPPRTPNFYLLPKIHKNKLPPPGRPIVSANGCPSERISQFVDHFIQPLVHKLPSYLRDSTHFINTIKDLKLPPDAIIASLDVTSLYTNIPNQEGISAASHYLTLARDPMENPTNYSILKLLELVLTTNNFQFDNKHFLQIGGTAMGTKLAPSFANLFMGHFESKYVATYKLQPFIWKRYIDDIFLVWTYGRKELDTFVSHLNSVHHSIKFTAEISRSSISFLDVEVIKEMDGSITTSLYCKPTDTRNYLLYSSEHPRHVLKGIPYSQFLRVRRIWGLPLITYASRGGRGGQH